MRKNDRLMGFNGGLMMVRCFHFIACQSCSGKQLLGIGFGMFRLRFASILLQSPGFSNLLAGSMADVPFTLAPLTANIWATGRDPVADARYNSWIY